MYACGHSVGFAMGGFTLVDVVVGVAGLQAVASTL